MRYTACQTHGGRVQLTPFASRGSKPIGRTEASTLQSAAALALSEVFQCHHATGATPLVLQNSKGGVQGANGADNNVSLSALACMPLFVPVHGGTADAWIGVAYVGGTQVFFDTQVWQLPARSTVSAQEQLQVCNMRLYL